MYKHTLKIAMITTAFVSAIASSTAFAGPDCTSEPKDTWMSEMAMQKKIINDYGFTIYKFKTTSGNCYEIYGTAVKKDDSKTSDKKDDSKTSDKKDDSKTSDKKDDSKTSDKKDDSKTSDDKDNADKVEERVKIEVYFHPVSGDIVKQKIED